MDLGWAWAFFFLSLSHLMKRVRILSVKFFCGQRLENFDNLKLLITKILL